MPPAPTRDDVRNYIGTNGTYSDDQIDTALAAEAAAQAKVCRVPDDELIGSAADLMTVAAPNTETGSYYGTTGYVEFRTVTCLRSGTVAPPTRILNGVEGDPDVEVLVWLYGEQSEIDGSTGDGGEPVADYYDTSQTEGFDVVLGTTYVVALVVYQNPTDHLGQVASVVNLIETIETPELLWPGDLTEALLRRVQRLLEMRSKPLGYQDTMTEFGVSATRVGPDPEIRRLEQPYRKLVMG